MGNDNAAMADFAQSLWDNYIRQKYEDASMNTVSFYRATVTSNDLASGGELRVSRPFDNDMPVNCTSGMKGVSEGDLVVVARLGNGPAAMNNLVFAKADGTLNTVSTLLTASYKNTASETWQCTGDSFALTRPAFVYLHSETSNGTCHGLGISKSDSHAVPRAVCYESSYVRNTPIFYVDEGLYYLYDKRATAASTANTMHVYQMNL